MEVVRESRSFQLKGSTLAIRIELARVRVCCSGSERRGTNQWQNFRHRGSEVSLSTPCYAASSIPRDVIGIGGVRIKRRGRQTKR